MARSDPTEFYSLHVPAAVLPVISAALLYGWTALLTIAIVIVSAWAAVTIWTGIGWRGRQLESAHCLWMALLLALILPPHLLEPRMATWAIVPGAGILLVVVAWALGPLGSGRVHVVLVTYLLLVSLFQPMMAAHLVLKPNHAFRGNLFNAEPIVTVSRTTPWLSEHDFADPTKDALDNPRPALDELTSYTSGRDQPYRFSVSAQMVVRDKLPPLEDLIIGGEPSALGISSAAAVIFGGLGLMFLGVVDWRIPMMAIIGAMIGFLILPIPLFITDLGPQWGWMAFRSHYLGWPVALTLANYELLASPLLFVAFFLATNPQVRPAKATARAIFGLSLGLVCAPAQLYGSAAIGPYVALLIVSLASPLLDRLCRHPTPQ